VKRFLKRGENFLFSLIVFLIPSQLGYHFFIKSSYVYGIRIDYLAPTIYLTDILILALFIFCLARVQKIKIKPWALALGGFALINLSTSNFSAASIYKWIKVGEAIFFGYYVFSKRNLLIKKRVLPPLALSVIVFSVIGIVQFFLQRSIGGLLYFLGERTFSSTTPGISLFTVFGRQFLRPYSTFSHPNSMAGFMLVAVLFLLSLANSASNRIIRTSLVFGIFSILISASLSSILAFITMGIFRFLMIYRRGFASKIIHVFLPFLMVFSIFLPLVARTYLKAGDSVVGENIKKRLILAEVVGKNFSDSPIWGIGLNNFIPKLLSSGRLPELAWWLQPVHNIFLLTLAEAGLIGLVILFLLFQKAIISAIRFSGATVFPLLAIFLTGYADHYWLTLQQNEILLSFILGLSFRRTL